MAKNYRETILTYEQAKAIDEEVEKQYKKSKGYKGFDWAYTDEDRRTLAIKMELRKREAQAKATWEARQKEVDEAEQRGIRKVVDWVENHRQIVSPVNDKRIIEDGIWHLTSAIQIYEDEWQAFLKSLENGGLK